MTKIVCHMVVKDEALKWLDSCLSWNSQWWDELHVYDDQSSDDTVRICQKYTSNVHIRPDGVVSFSENEGKFRQAAWESLEKNVDLDGAWVFCLDADEFLVGNSKNLNPYDSLLEYVKYAEKVNKLSVSMSVPEVWDVSGMRLRVRVDGFWAKNKNIRFAKYVTGGLFSEKEMGSGSLPTYANACVNNISLVSLLHFGYAIPEQVKKKAEFYSSLKDHGHSNDHIKSISAKPTLRDWDGEVPLFWRGT